MTSLTVLGSRDILGKTVTAFGTVENPIFSATDVAEWIEHSNVSAMLQGIDDDEKVLLEVPTIDSNDCLESTKQGNLRTKRWFLTEDGLYEVLMTSRLPIAKMFRKGLKQFLRDVRMGKILVSNTQLEQENSILRQKLQLFEEYNEDILYDFDQVSAAMRIYRKPPFGASHLKQWLADKKILCSAHYKNDKPNQRYIEKDWFRLVMHEWKRRGQRRYEPRYLITQRGFNAMIDMAIREKFICLPVPKNYCLPYVDESLPPEAGGDPALSFRYGNELE